MKNIVVAFLLLLICYKTIQAQEREYIPFPTADAEWKTIYTNTGNLYDLYQRKAFLYTIGNDTLIEGASYKKLNLNDNYCAALREEDKRVYVHLPDYGEHLLYDFNLEVGDTISYTLSGYYNKNGFIFYPAEHIRIVDSIREFELKTGEIRKKLYMKDYSGWDGSQWIIEGMRNEWVEVDIVTKSGHKDMGIFCSYLLFVHFLLIG